MNISPELYDKTNKLQANDAEYIIQRLISDFQDRVPELIVDLGCGTGNITARVGQLFPETRIIGVDNSPEMIVFARENYSNKKIHFHVGDISKPWALLLDEISVGKDSCDAVMSSFCIHWVEDKKMAMENISNLLKPGGRCYLVMFSWSPLLPLQEQIVYQEPWNTLLSKLDLIPKPKDRLDKMIISKVNTNRPQEGQIMRPNRKKSSASFEVYETPPEEERIQVWSQLCQQTDLKPIEIRVDDKKYTFENIEGFKGELLAICHFLIHIPKEMHQQFIEDYYEHMNECFISKQNTLPEIKTTYQILTVIAEK